MRSSIHARLCCCFSFALALRADERTQKLAERWPARPQAFEKIAPELVGRETLHQRVMAPPARFKIRVGDDATHAPVAAWKEHEIVSEYAFTSARP